MRADSDGLYAQAISCVGAIATGKCGHCSNTIKLTAASEVARMFSYHPLCACTARTQPCMSLCLCPCHFTDVGALMRRKRRHLPMHWCIQSCMCSSATRTSTSKHSALKARQCYAKEATWVTAVSQAHRLQQPSLKLLARIVAVLILLLPWITKGRVAKNAIGVVLMLSVRLMLADYKKFTRPDYCIDGIWQHCHYWMAATRATVCAACTGRMNRQELNSD